MKSVTYQLGLDANKNDITFALNLRAHENALMHNSLIISLLYCKRNLETGVELQNRWVKKIGLLESFPVNKDCLLLI